MVWIFFREREQVLATPPLKIPFRNRIAVRRYMDLSG
jgi:hypothetical protein